jgi:hypothetical protein
MPTAIVIPVDPKEPIRQEELHKNDLDAYRQLVGGNLEVLNLERPPATLYFNEEGKLVGMPVNRRATALLWVHNSGLRGRDVIVGPAFVVGPPDRQGDDRSVPEDLVELLLGTKRYRVQVQIQGSQAWSGKREVFADWFEACHHAVQLTRLSTAVEEVRVVPELADELRATWYRIGRENPWIREADDPPFTPDSFLGCYSIVELEERLGHGNWAVGTAFYYRDLCFIQQVEGGDEWLTIRHGVGFENVTVGPSVEDGSFGSLVTRLLTASREQCRRLEY